MNNPGSSVIDPQGSTSRALLGMSGCVLMEPLNRNHLFSLARFRRRQPPSRLERPPDFAFLRLPKVVIPQQFLFGIGRPPRGDGSTANTRLVCPMFGQLDALLDRPSHPVKQKPPICRGLLPRKMVGGTGFEPVASCL